MVDPVRAFLDDFVQTSDFARRYPYYTAVLANMVPVADPSVKRMAVSLHEGRFFLHVNVDSFLREPQWLRGVLLHEVHHVVLGHLSHPKFADPAEPELLELALEMSANEFIEEPLPDPITWQKYTAFGIRAGQSSLERYEKLLEAARAGKFTAKHAPGGETVDEHRLLRRAAGAPGSAEQARMLVARAMDAAGDVGPEGPPERRLLAGKEPGRLLAELDGVLGPPECFVDWKTALRMFASRRRTPVGTFARPSRRFPSRIGEVPGRAWSPRAMARPRVLVTIDTSMSMTDAELAEIAKQLALIAEEARITVVECDSEIQRVYPFTGAITDVQGRGGTDLRKVFAEGFWRPHAPDGIVYFTDGEGPFPEEPPPVPTLWILTKPQSFACPWGERAILERRPRAVTHR
ncbi:VWA-like domain-containing protein [Polyangium sp. 6x1]|uniref:vWA domain-containing protein n=1 Tax=Polyangium sp. 6x1 TaxID=3042689 RepID=UPI00248273D7|nr:VWA-like domain-containing protein [Polyangium sp. 6x1]MDI1445509.1 VWA-like domain-containing protein [Polyangium sp. 6x1]